MSLIYNTQNDFASSLSNFLHISCPFLHKPLLKIIPHIIYGMINSESSVTLDIAKHLKEDFSLIQPDSVSRRIRRFFNNSHFNPYLFYDSIIKHVISSYKKKHPDKRIHIIIDHMFSHDNYTVLMMSMRIGKQGIPLWFRCFKGKDDSNAFQDDLFIQGINFISDLFDDSFDLIFLADRFFNSSKLMYHIDSLGHTYCFRLKKNIKISIFDKKENHYILKWISDLSSYEFHPAYYNNIFYTEESRLLSNIVISQRHGYNEPWIIITNGDVTRAIKDYGYRFGGIESLFKNQKSNGFYIESINNASLTAFSNMYSLVCFATLFLTIIGCDFAKNTKCYKNIKIRTHQIRNGVKVRVLSLFNTGLTLIKLAFNSLKYIRIPYSFILYDS